MADILAIAGSASKAAERFRSRDPFSIAEAEGVRVCFYDLGSLNGMYTVLDGVSFIALSESLGVSEARLVCAHELGHHFLHQSIARTTALADSTLFSGGGRLEYEANIFAAELLVPDEALREAVKTCPDIACAASELDVHPEILAVKSEILRNKGTDLNPIEIKVDFLRKELQKRN
ncbi:MAG: ImmA/IrrE family metallo-endopeptidase [Clostridia bacterium]|nr:ImmA/IrrE family metallo-endopeptidase [Clostridia bacterium]